MTVPVSSMDEILDIVSIFSLEALQGVENESEGGGREGLGD